MKHAVIHQVYFSGVEIRRIINICRELGYKFILGNTVLIIEDMYPDEVKPLCQLAGVPVSWTSCAD